MKKWKANKLDELNYLKDCIGTVYLTYCNYRGISALYLQIISFLYFEQANTQSQICRLVGAPKQTVNDKVKFLYKKGYIQFSASENDKREKVIELTTSGIEYIEDLYGELQKIKCDVVNKMGEKKMKKATELMSEYYRIIAEDMDEFMKTVECS